MRTRGSFLLGTWLLAAGHVGVALAAGTGAELYAKHCSACHGTTGRGDGTAAYLLQPKPRNFASGKFRLISTVNRVPTDQDLKGVLVRGMPGSGMPPWAHLPGADLDALVAEVRRLTEAGIRESLLASGSTPEELAEELPDRTRPGDLVAVPPETPRDGKDIEKGKAIYAKTCASCHGADGRGKSQSPLKTDDGFPTDARDFTLGVFKGPSTGPDLVRRILAGLPGSPMPGYQGAFPTDADLWALVHYIQSLVKPGMEEKLLQKQLELRVARVAPKALPTKPDDPAWAKVASTRVNLMPLWWRNERPEGVEVQAVHDGTKVALRLRWRDATSEEHILDQTSFADAAAIQFSAEADPPFFGMGAVGHPVTIWQWKAHWQKDLAGYVDHETVHPRVTWDLYAALKAPPYGSHSKPGDFTMTDFDPSFMSAFGAGNPLADPDRRSAVETLQAVGYGTSRTQSPFKSQVQGVGQWKAGEWSVVFERELTGEQAGTLPLPPEAAVSVAFAIWDGAAQDRNGQKSLTIWHRMVFEK